MRPRRSVLRAALGGAAAGVAPFGAGRVVGHTRRDSARDETAPAGGRGRHGPDAAGVQGRPETELLIGARTSGWRGVEPPAIEDEPNPTLRLVAGERYTVFWENEDGAPHEFVLEDAAGEAVVRSARRTGVGTSAEVSFVATPDLERYVCAVHPGTMRGRVLVGETGFGVPGGLTAAASGPPPDDDEDERPSRASLTVSFDPGGRLEWRLTLRNLDGVTQANVRERAGGVTGPVVVPLVRFAASPDGRAGGDPRDVPGDSPLVLTGAVDDASAVRALADRPDEHLLVVHTVDYPRGQVLAPFATVDAVDLFSVRVENVAAADALVGPGGPVPVVLSPGVYAVHDDGNPLFVPGRPDQRRGLEALAEDGDPAPLAASVAGTVADSGTFDAPVGGTGPGAIAPGGAYEFPVAGRPRQRLALATKLGGTNDLFYGTGGIPLFDDREVPFDGDATRFLALYDAGTEADEPPGAGPNQPPRQAAPDTGPREFEPVTRVSTADAPGDYPPAASVLRVTVRPTVAGDDPPQ